MASLFTSILADTIHKNKNKKILPPPPKKVKKVESISKLDMYPLYDIRPKHHQQPAKSKIQKYGK